MTIKWQQREISVLTFHVDFCCPNNIEKFIEILKYTPIEKYNSNI